MILFLLVFHFQLDLFFCAFDTLLRSHQALRPFPVNLNLRSTLDTADTPESGRSYSTRLRCTLFRPCLSPIISMQEFLAAEHRREQFLNGNGIANECAKHFESAWWNIADGRFAMVRYPCWTFVPRLLPSCYDRLSSTVAYYFSIAAMTFTILKLNFEVTSFWILMIDKTKEETVISVFYSISNTIQGNTWPNRHSIDFNTNNSQNSNLFLCSKIYRYGRSC